MVYGRRKGRTMRPRRKALVNSLLPQIRIKVESCEERSPLLNLEQIFRWDPKEVWLEIGFGAGEHLANLAQINPKVGFIGCDPFLEGVGKLLSQIDSYNLNNIRIFPGDARKLMPALPSSCLGKVLLLFPDPWPKYRHHKRRIVNQVFLDSVERILCNEGEFVVATDHEEYGNWILNQLLRHDAFCRAAHITTDWTIRPELGERTRYEDKALRAGRNCYYLRFRKLDIDRRLHD